MWWAALLNSFVSILDSGGAVGGAASFESIATVTASGSSATLTFSSIPSTYKHLQIRGIAKSGAGSGQRNLTMEFNASTGSNHAWHRLFGDGTNAGAEGTASTGSIRLGGASIQATPASTFGVSIIDIIDYASTTKNKTVKYFSGSDTNASPTAAPISLGSGVLLSTTAITSISISDAGFENFAVGTVFSLYGIKGA
jgi:hypothetical protein